MRNFRFLNKKNFNNTYTYSIDTNVSKENWVNNGKYSVCVNRLTGDKLLFENDIVLNEKCYLKQDEGVDGVLNMSVKLARLAYEKMIEIIDDYSALENLTNDLIIKETIFNLKSNLSVLSLTMQAVYSELSGEKFDKYIEKPSDIPNSFCFGIKYILQKLDVVLKYVTKLDKLILAEGVNRQLIAIKDDLFMQVQALIQMQVNCFY